MTKVIGVARAPRNTAWRRERKYPTLSEVEEEVRLNNYIVDPNRFFNYYEASGWIMGNKPIIKWQAILKLWEDRARSKKQFAYDGYVEPMRKSPNDELIKQTYTQEEIASVFRTLDEINPETELI